MYSKKDHIAPMRLRIAALMIDYLVIFTYGMVLWGFSFLFKPVNKDRKSLYDWIAGTKVISISTKPKSGRV